MSMNDSQKTLEIIRATEEVADEILVNKQEVIELDKRRQHSREALRELEKNPSMVAEQKVWITVGSVLVKMEREKAIALLKADQHQIEQDIGVLRTEQKVLVNKHRDLEHFTPFSGTNLKPLDAKEMNAMKANFPFL